MMLNKLIQTFCEKQDNYEYCATVDETICDNPNCVGVLINSDASYVEMLMKLTEFLDTEGYTDSNCELEGVSVEECGDKLLIYFPCIG